MPVKSYNTCASRILITSKPPQTLYCTKKRDQYSENADDEYVPENPKIAIVPSQEGSGTVSI